MNLSGQKLGDYELHDLIGSGGMGAVYRGYHRALNREVAVKVIQFGVNSADLQARFIREAQTAANLEHAHIVRIYHYGVERDVNYIAMQYLPGASLAERLELAANQQRPAISLSETALLLTNLASALDYAHSEGVVHRDIKPQNIMFNKRGQAYIVDFGIAKLLNGETNLTGPRLAMGTANFMPPEQWASEELTGAADQYALAVSAFQLMTQRLPFEADTPLQVMHKHKYEQPTPIGMFRPDLPSALQPVIEKALSKDAADRYESCSAFAQDFAAAVENIERVKTGFFTFPVASLPPLAPGSRTPSPENTPVSSGYLTALPSAPPSGSWVRGAMFGVGLLAVAAVFIVALLASRGGDSGSDMTLTAVNATLAAVVLITDAPTEESTVPASKAAIANVSGARGLSPTPSPTATETSVPTQTPFPSLTPTSEPSQTPAAENTESQSAAVIPPTATETPAPSQTPEPTATIAPTETATPTETPLPSATFEPSPSATPSETPTETPSPVVTADAPTSTVESAQAVSLKPTLDVTATVESIAISGVSRNGDWPVVERDINGVAMMLVPAGCFIMGSEDGEASESPVHQMCFDAPYWIDKTEVTQGQFGAMGGVKANPNRFNGEGLPVETVTWFEARNYCVLRGGTLPTEAQWEYAARGPESWAYPWGSDADNQTVKIGDAASTASWVGAQGMGGNVWEWTSSAFMPYPYNPADGREANNGTSTRVSRGGANSLSVTFHSAYRINVEPMYTSESFGFRCAMRFDGWGDAAAVPGSAPMTITVLVPSVNLRGGPGTQYNVVGSASLGDLFPLIAQSGGWYLIAQDDGSRAWLSGELVDVLNPSGAAIEFALTVPAAPVGVQPTSAPQQQQPQQPPPNNPGNPGNPGNPPQPTNTPVKNIPPTATPPVSVLPTATPHIIIVPTEEPWPTPTLASCGVTICEPQIEP